MSKEAMKLALEFIDNLHKPGWGNQERQQAITALREALAERENATARMELARMRECCNLLISQHDPVASLGIDRKALKVLLDFVQHHDPARLRREIEAHGIKGDA